MQPERPARPHHRPLGPRMRARREAARAEAVVRLARWKRTIGAGAVIAFGALLGLVGVAGAKGDDKPSGTTTAPRSPSVTSQLARPDRDDDGGTPTTTTAGDGYFGGQDGGYGFTDSGSQSEPLGQSSVS
jgi:hypothetical protein